MELAELLKETPIVIDGSMSTPLEIWGAQTDSDLWTAAALINHPDLVKRVHQAYFEAGARITITDSYQTNVAAFEKHGYGEQAARRLIRLSAQLAQTARDEYEKATGVHNLVAGSIGPYGAYLADGSEYRGDYELSLADYQDFHAPRLEELLAAGVDCLAIETQPKLAEVTAILAWLHDHQISVPVWVSFSLQDPQTISEGTALTQAVEAIQDDLNVLAVGVNCMPITMATPAVETIAKVASVPIIVYPNSGAQYDPITKTWQTTTGQTSFAQAAVDWVQAGAGIIGGCCTTMPKDIQEIKLAIAKES